MTGIMLWYIFVIYISINTYRTHRVYAPEIVSLSRIR